MVDVTVLTRHLHSALRHADDEEARFHIRHALQYLEDASSNADGPRTDGAGDSLSAEGR